MSVGVAGGRARLSAATQLYSLRLLSLQSAAAKFVCSGRVPAANIDWYIFARIWICVVCF